MGACDLKLVGEAAGGEEGVRLCERVQPDVALMDMVMPSMDGATATRAIRERCPETRVIRPARIAQFWRRRRPRR